VDHVVIQRHLHVVEVQPPVTKAAHARDVLSSDITGNYRPEPVPPRSHRFMENVDPALEQPILDVPQRQLKPPASHHYRPDHLWRRIEEPKRAGGLGPRLALRPASLAAAPLV